MGLWWVSGVRAQSSLQGLATGPHMNAAPFGRWRREAGALGAGIGLSSPGKLGLSTSPTQKGNLWVSSQVGPA